MQNYILKSLLLVSVVIALIFSLSSVGYCQDDALIEKAANEAISKAIISLSKGEKVTGIERIAVYPLEVKKTIEASLAYDDEITDLLTISLSKTRYRVILRQQLLDVMKEHGFVLGKVDLFNPDSVKKLGGFLGVDAIIFGTVKEASSDLNGARVRLNLKMADVTTGELVWADAVSGFVSRSAAKPSLGDTIAYFLKSVASNKRVVTGILIVIGVIIVLSVTKTKGKHIKEGIKKGVEQLIPGYDYARRENRLKTDRAIRNKIVGELSKSITTLQEARDIAYKNNQTEVVNQLKELSNSIDSLRLEVENAEYGNSSFFVKDAPSSSAIARMVEFDRTFDSLVKEVSFASKEVYEDTSASKIADISNKTKEIQKKISQLRNKIRERKDYLIGMA